MEPTTEAGLSEAELLKIADAMVASDDPRRYSISMTPEHVASLIRRAAVGTPDVAALREALIVTSRDSHGHGYANSAHVRYVRPGIHDEPRYEHFPFDECPAEWCVKARTALVALPDAPSRQSGDPDDARK